MAEFCPFIPLDVFCAEHLAVVWLLIGTLKFFIDPDKGLPPLLIETIDCSVIGALLFFVLSFKL